MITTMVRKGRLQDSNDSMAEMDPVRSLPCWGYGIRYSYGMFKQGIKWLGTSSWGGRRAQLLELQGAWCGSRSVGDIKRWQEMARNR